MYKFALKKSANHVWLCPVISCRTVKGWLWSRGPLVLGYVLIHHHFAGW